MRKRVFVGRPYIPYTDFSIRVVYSRLDMYGRGEKPYIVF